MRTKNGNGFKIFANNEWYYTNSIDVEKFFNGEIAVVTFRTIDRNNDSELVKTERIK
jgi:hypothetical protein